MPETPPELRAEQERQEILGWLKRQIEDYRDVFALTDEDLRDRKFLEIGAGDRRLAAALIAEGINRDVTSLEPGLAVQKPGFAEREFLEELSRKLPPDIRAEVDKRTVAATAEAMPFGDDSFDVVLGRSVPFESIDQLTQRIRESLRVAKELRFYPVDERNKSQVDAAIAAASKAAPIDVEFRTTLETTIPSQDEKGRPVVRRVKEDVVIIRRKE